MTGETIAALATGRGAAALAIIRLSGPDAFAMVSARLRPAPPLGASREPIGRVGRLLDAGRAIDQVVVWFYRAPHSYTGEDVVEIVCHGGPLAPASILKLVLRDGARLARPGEFTLQAFLNGKLDLAQAEAVEAMIASRSTAAAQAAMRGLEGGLRRELAPRLDRLTEMLARIEATLDIQEDGAPDTLSPLWTSDAGATVPPAAPAVLRGLEAERDALARLSQGARAGRLLEEGLRVVIAGRPNAGKSSLFNALLARDRAIVDADPGTTRDLLEGWVEWDGLPVVLIDTAGLREATAPPEQEGVRRARAALAGATLVVQVVDVADATPASVREDAERLGVPGERIVTALHKWDLGAGPAWNEVRRQLESSGTDPSGSTVVSSVVGEPGVEGLRRALVTRLREGVGDPEATLLVGERQRDTLTRALEALELALELMRQGHGGELVAFELRRSLGRLGEILGRRVGPEVLEAIFARFCVGK
jgi:tRNA modification GTPase